MAALLAFAPPAPAQGNSEGQANAEAIRNWNTRVLQFQTQLANSPASLHASIRAQAAPVFQQRAAALATLAGTDPQAVLATAFSADVLRTLAASFPGAPLEQQGEFTGLAEHVVLDDDSLTRGRSDIRMKIGSEWVKVNFAGEIPEVKCNDFLRVRGVKIGAAVAAADGAVSGSGGTSSTCSTTGTQYIAVLLVTFPGVTPPSGVTPSMVQNIFFQTGGRSVDGFWKETSQGRTSARGQVFGWFTLDAAYSCDQYYQMRDAAIRAADTSVDFRSFNRVMIVFPKPAGCGWAGLGTIGCSTLSSAHDGSFTASVAWLSANYMGGIDNGVKLATHEGGHNLGLHHARTYDYGAAPLGAIGTTGTVTEYGDVFSTMGSWNLGHYSAPNKVRLGWFDTSVQAPTVQSSGVYDLVPFEQGTAGRQALKVQRGTGNNAWLWLEYRQPFGLYDSTLGSQVFSGALVHYDESATSYSNLLDFTPETSAWTDPALTAGKTWTDPYSNVSLQVVSASASGLSVAVTYGATPCVRAAPILSVSPANPSGLPGAGLDYTVTVANKDSASCPPATFLPGSTAPSGWTTTYSTSGLTVNPGASAAFTMRKTIPTAATPATYAANVNVSDASHTQSAAASATVTAPLPALSATLTGPAATVALRSTVTLTATVRSGTNPALSAQVTFRVTQPSGAVSTKSAVTNSAGVATYSLKVTKAGAYSASATAVLGAQAAATNTIAFTVK